MRIACPTCGAAYDVPESRVAMGRTVRCARCAATWTPLPLAEAPEEPVPEAAVPEVAVPQPEPAVEPEPEPVAEPEPEPVAVPVAEPEPPPEEPPPPEPMPPAPAIVPVGRPRRRAGLVAAWVLSALVLAGLCWGAVARRAEIVRAWPPAERAYVALGLMPHP